MIALSCLNSFKVILILLNCELMLVKTASFSYIHFCFFHHNRAAVRPRVTAFWSSKVNKLQQAPRCLAILDHSRELRDHRGEGTRSRRRKHQCGQKQQVTPLEKTSHDLSRFFSQQLHIYNDEFTKLSFIPSECFDVTRCCLWETNAFLMRFAAAQINTGADVQHSGLIVPTEGHLLR